MADPAKPNFATGYTNAQCCGVRTNDFMNLSFTIGVPFENETFCPISGFYR